MSDEKPKYEVIEYQGKPARLYPDGAIRNEKGHWLAMHPGAVPITHENARELQARRWLLATEKTAEWITKEAQSIDPDIRDVYDAHAFMMAKQYTTIIDSDRPRMDDAEKLAQAMGTMPRSAELRQQTQAEPPVQAIADAVSARLEDVFRDVIQRQVIDGTVSDVIPMRSDSEPGEED